MELFAATVGSLDITFNAEDGGLPSVVTVTEADGRKTTLFGQPAWRLELELADGRVLHPVATPEQFETYEDKDGLHVDFLNVHFQDAQGTPFPNHYLTLRHEFLPDGTAFTNAFFFVREENPVGIVRMELKSSLNLGDFDDVRWSCRPRPLTVDGTLITAPVRRFMDAGQDEVFPGAIVPAMGFSATRDFAPALYAEVFVEGHSTLSGKVQDAQTAIHWQGHSPEFTWTFQNGPFPKPNINQLRNQWGWVVRPAQACRHLPPMRMYHYFDNYLRYPTDDIIAAIADTGCDILVMHENWRTDSQNDGIPFDAEAFRRLRDALHTKGIRLAVYIRGNEESVCMRQASWFPRLLTPNFDGLYMDYGGPFNRGTKPNESYCGGRILFREHYHHMRTLREVVGPDGLLFSHTGPSFSGMSMPFMTGYVSGEGERGMLLRGRREHAYFSMATVITGTLWSAAFPEYASPAIVPHLAATGQYPHSALGRQFLTSSLVHPSVPGVNDTAFVPLWHLWSLFREERDILVTNDFNSAGVFPKDVNAGHYLMRSSVNGWGMLILSNFANERRAVECSVDWGGLGLDLRNLHWALLQDGKASLLPQNTASVELNAYGVAGILFSCRQDGLVRLMERYNHDEPALSECGKEYLREVETQRRTRLVEEPWHETWLRISIPPLSPTPYEDSMTNDLYDNAHELLERLPDGTLRRLGWLDRTGLVPELDPRQNLFAGVSTPPLCLNRILGRGRHSLAIRSTHKNDPFYIFCQAELSPEAQFTSQTRIIQFLNDLEPDRAYLRFEVGI
ncbi:MAG: hypothetical protein IJJ33_00095 [Victivallales bacterium]|nr:hypothetical protein [Victivallales bacterium]